MPIKEIIQKRRSIRKYKNKKIPKNLIKEILEAGILAPSGCNVQPTRYFLIKDKNLIKRLKQKRAFVQDFVYKAPLIIVLCGNPHDYKSFKEIIKDRNEIPKNISESKITAILKNKEKEKTIRDISITSVFIVLQATELGLGTCYIGLINENVLKQELKIPKDYIIPFVITMGYPVEFPKQSPRKRLNELILKTYN